MYLIGLCACDHEYEHITLPTGQAGAYNIKSLLQLELRTFMDI